jgi:hypothetical protein
MSKIAQVASEGDMLNTLIELRDNTAVRLELCQSDQNFVSLSRLLLDTNEKIKELQAAAPGTGGTLDELASRRAASGRPNATSAVGATRKAK